MTGLVPIGAVAMREVRPWRASGRTEVHRGGRGGDPGRGRGRAIRPSRSDLGGSGDGVHLEEPGPLGLLEPGAAGFQPAGEADGQRVRRGIQLAAAARMLIATLLYRRGGRPTSPRPMAG